MDAHPVREAWRRLPWRRWFARGALLGLCAATVFGVAVFIVERESILLRHPALKDWWWPYLALAVCTLLTLLAILTRKRFAILALIGISVVVLLFEWQLIGLGPHLMRVPVSLLIAMWADRALR